MEEDLEEASAPCEIVDGTDHDTDLALAVNAPLDLDEITGIHRCTAGMRDA